MDAFCVAMLSSLLLVMAVSLDAFTASFAYGTNKIRIPMVSILIISAISTGMLTVSILLSSFIKSYIPSDVTMIISFLLLTAIGLSKIFDGYVKYKIKKCGNLVRKLNFNFFNLHCILSIYADPQNADLDNSKEISPTEAITLSVALSIDGLTAGFGMDIAPEYIVYVAFMSLAIGIAVIVLGSFLGRKLSEITTLNLSWIGGVLLIILAITKLHIMN